MASFHKISTSFGLHGDIHVGVWANGESMNWPEQRRFGTWLGSMWRVEDWSHDEEGEDDEGNHDEAQF